MFIEPEPQTIRRNFGLISKGYDRANDVMALGLLRLWRKRLVEWADVGFGDKVLDTATGTGDLAFLFKEKVGDTGQVFGLDFTPEMLEIAREREWENELPVYWQIGDVMKLEHEDNTFDASSISFGIRNVQDPKKALTALARVTKPGGRVMILETGCPHLPIWREIYSVYFKTVLPKIGGWISGHSGPYKFLQRSSLSFPSGEEFTSWMHETKAFESVEYESFLGGVAYLYKGISR